MKIKTSITLSEDLVKAIDNLSRQSESRSEFIEMALWFFIKQMLQKNQELKDLEILNKQADYLNQEAVDVLSYQVAL